MRQPVENLLQNLKEIIEQQLIAAKKMDVQSLSAATEVRQDILFELELESNVVEKTPDLQRLVADITLLDQRLMHILEIVSDTCKTVNPSKVATTYNAKAILSKYKA